MRIRQLQCFVAVCEMGSITKAARNLNIAQPALGVQMRGLEEELGVVLLNRQAGGVTPTEEGKLLLIEATQIIERIENLKRRFNVAQTTGISIGLPTSLMKPLGGSILARIQAVSPGTEVHLSEAPSHTLVANIENGELDVAIAFGESTGARLISEGQFEENLYFITAKGSPMDAPGPITFGEMSRGALMLPDEKNFISQLIEDTARQHGIDLKPAYRIDSLQAMKDVMRKGIAQAILPWSTISEEVEAGELVARLIVEPHLIRTLHILRPVGVPAATVSNAILSRLRDIVRDYFAHTKNQVRRISPSNA